MQQKIATIIYIIFLHNSLALSCIKIIKAFIFDSMLNIVVLVFNIHRLG